MPDMQRQMPKRGKRRRQRVLRFLQPCLLLMLTRDEAHGYSLMDDLDEFGFDPNRFDPSLVYRALREMEDSGLVSSRWDDDSQGPRRRVYQILPQGEALLAEWIADLRRTRAEIDRLLANYEKEVQMASD
jgi:DNA-binding PadR family transcriptional regulator